MPGSKSPRRYAGKTPEYGGELTLAGEAAAMRHLGERQARIGEQFVWRKDRLRETSRHDSATAVATKAPAKLIGFALGIQGAA